MNQDIKTYHCPDCNNTLAVGNILSLQIKCPICGENITMNPKDGFVSRGKDPNEGTIQKTYGRDKLTIEQMTNTQKDCLKAEHSHYFTGKRCKWNHIAPRTKRGECHTCTTTAARNFARDNRAKVTVREQKSRNKNRKHYLDLQRKYRETKRLDKRMHDNINE